MSRKSKKQRQKSAPAIGDSSTETEAAQRGRVLPLPGSGQTVEPRATERWSGRDWMFALALVVALLLAYHPAWHGTPIWDDDAHLTKPELCSWAGLGRIWFQLGATQQYYPVTHSAFWLQHWLWGDAFSGYHLVNVLLHALSALLLARVLRRLEIPGAWLAAAIWALHPVQVESVAWMSELKNTLSAVFYMGAALFYLRFDRERSVKYYPAALGLFILGLLTKSVIATLPAALLLIFYWKYEKLRWRKDVRPLILFFAIGIFSGLFTSWVERTLIGADGGDFHFSLLERGLIAGRAFWFYPGKLIWPANLIFIYPRWTISTSGGWQFLYPALALGLVGLLVWKRKYWGTGPLVAVLYFAGTLFPALGFLNIYPFRFSFVADHFQYLASIGPIVLATVGIARLFDFLSGKTSTRFSALRFQVSGFSFQVLAFVTSLLITLGFLTWNQCGMYANMETLWRTTIARNPGCWMAYNNLGLLMENQGRVAETIARYHQALKVNPGYAKAHNNLGTALLQQGRTEEAIDQFHEALTVKPSDADAHSNLGDALLQKRQTMDAIDQFRAALQINPNYAEAHDNLGAALLQQGRIEEAIGQFREALQIKPSDADAHSNLGDALLQKRQPGEAIEEFQSALKINPANAQAHNNLGNALFQLGRTEESIEQLREALRINPSYADAHYNLGNALFRQGQTKDAIAHVKNAFELQPDNVVMQNELAWMLATVPQASLRNGAMAMELAMNASRTSTGSNNALILRTLAAAYAETGDFSNALQTARSALELAEARSNADLVGALRREIKFYEVGRPFRDRQ